MLFKTALRRDLSNLAGVVFATLFTVMVTTSLIRWLGRAANGLTDTASVLPMIAFGAINLLPVLLVLTVYVSVLMALTRAYRDSEMVIWFSSGRSLLDWILPVLGFVTPVAVLVALVAFVGGPWATRQSDEYQARFSQREDISRVSAGQFRESASAGRVFYVESLNDDNTEVRNVFVSQLDAQRELIVVSQKGQIEVMPNGDRYLVLEKGRRYDGEPGSSSLRLMEFERYGLLLEGRADVSGSGASARTMGLLDLLADPSRTNLAELNWRLSLPISAFLMALLAIPLSAVNPRLGRSVNLILALLIYVVYNNMLSVVSAWIGQGRLPFLVGVWVVHAALAVVIAFLFWRRIRLPRRWIRRALSPSSAGAA
ncbi:MAG: LPS export ABC transporter permease LptF [Betaproteobacteria bacterium]|nr:LPS export ABC transporter permease LptF [Betaproteobacteria bacterium]